MERHPATNVETVTAMARNELVHKSPGDEGEAPELGSPVRSETTRWEV